MFRQGYELFLGCALRKLSGRQMDCTCAVIEELGTLLLHVIAIKPDKPAILGIFGVKPVLGVQGYPMSGIIVIEQLFKSIVEIMIRCLTNWAISCILIKVLPFRRRKTC